MTREEHQAVSASVPVGNVFTGSGRVAWWITDLQLLGYLPQLATAANSSFTDYFLPRLAAPADIKKVRAQTRALDGAGSGAHLHEIAFTSGIRLSPNVQAALKLDAEGGTKEHAYHVPAPKEDANAAYKAAFGADAAQGYVDQVLADLARLEAAGVLPGTVDLDIEVDDTILGAFMRVTVNLIRARRRTYLIRINHAPNKQGFLPVDLLLSDPSLYVAYQLYYGEMSRVSEWFALARYGDLGIPRAKCHPCYGTATQAHVRDAAGNYSWQRVSNIPDAYYNGAANGKVQGPSTFFSEALGLDVGLVL